MKSKLTIPDDNSFIVSTRLLRDRGILTLEQYAAVLRRNSITG